MKFIKWLIGLPMKTKIISAVVAGTIIVGSGVGIGIAVNNSKEPEHTHSYTQQTTTEATCTTKGVITYTCSCNDTYTEEIPVLGHDEKTHEAKAPTCTEIGWNEYVTCERDGCEYSTYEEIPATGNHTWNNGEITTEPTCTETGVKTFTCTVCQTATYTEDVNALEHDTKTYQAQNPTCTEIGWNEYVTCEREGCDYSTYKELPALKHDEKTHKAQAPTCTEIGWNEYVTCEREGCDYSTHEELPALKHDEKTHEAQAPTCTEIGWNEYVTCEREGCGYSTYEELPATGIHTWDNGTETKTPTCTKEGETTYLCTVCKKITKTEPIETLPHEHAKEWSYNETHHYHECKCGDKADETKHSPSAPATATTKQKCTICGYVIQEETGILFNTLSVNATKVYGKVSNATTEFSFINEVLIKGSATYVVDNDKDCGSPIASKTVDLNVGDNVFYVLESAGNNVKLYTVTIRRRPMYDVTFNTNGGTAVEKQIVEEDSFAVEPEVSKQGYTLAGWDYDFTLPITKNTHITAIWDADNGTKYTVNYYLQNIDDDNYTLYETDELKGITNTTIEAVVKVYQHFTYNEAKSTVEGIVKPNGSLVLSVYYTRNSYTIQVGTEIVNVGSEITQTGGVRYGVEVICTTSLTDGYTFLGWYDGVNLVSTDIEFVFIAEKDVIYMAKWQANDDTKYIVNYYCQNIENDEYTLYDTKEFTGTTDTTAAATVYEYDHFTYNESISMVSGNIHGDGSLVLSVYYTRNKYTVQAGYYLENVSSSITQIETWKYGSECTASVTLIDGYTWLGWYEYDGSELQFVNDNLSFSFTVEKDVTYYQCWKLNEDTKYTVNYYLQNIDNNEYTLYETEELTGTTDTLATAEIKQYPHFTYKESISTISDYIKGDGSLVLSVYYTRDSYTVTTSGNNTKAGTYKQINGKYRYDKEITLTATTNAGYTFLGWYEGEVLACRTTEFTFKAERNVTYTAKWQANDNTRYTVKYYLQNLDNNEYTLKETANLTGTTDSVVTATIKEYDHYIHNANISVISGNVKGDNSLVLSVYYTRATYDIVVNGNSAKAGTYTQINGNYRYGKELTLTATTNAGYTWLGWYEGETLVSETAEFTFEVEKDVTYTAKWYTLNDTKYTVNYYLQNIDDDNYILQETVELMDTVDTTATATIKTYPHFTYNVSKSTISGNIHGDGSLVLSVYYTRDNYTVNTSGNNAKAGTYTQLDDTYRFDKEITLSATTNAGYTFLGWYDGDLLVGQNLNFTFNVEKDVTYTAKWQANEDTKYKVNYYWQNIDNDEYTLKETVELTGVTDTTATAEIKTYSHFTYNAGASTTSGNIHGNGSLILKVYYTRDSYTVNTSGNNTKAGTYTQLNDKYRFDKEITLSATINAGYTFLGWYDGDSLVGQNLNFTFNIEKDVTYTAKWQANEDTKYKVNYYWQNIDNDEYTLKETVELTGMTDTTATAEIKTYSHFTYSAGASTISGNINGDGSQILKVYYTRANYTVTANRNNTKAGTITGGGSYSYDKQITLTATTNAGYTFLGWYEGENRVCETANFTFKVQKNATYTAKWQANTDTKYNVNYYLQNVDNNEYTLYESNELKGETNTIVTATVKEYEHFTYKASASVISGTINGDGSLVLNVYYTRDTYTIATEINNAKAGTVNQGGTYRFDKQITLTATTNAGYTFLGWHEGDVCVCATETFTFNVEKTATYTAKWQANEDTVYTVKYYWQNIDNDNYTVHETVELTGTTDTNVTAEVKTYQHFTYNENKSIISGNINGNDSQVLSVYYTRDSYTITAQRNNTKAGTVSGAGSYRFDKQITLTATTNAGYTFLGWYEGETCIYATEAFTFNVDGDSAYTAKWQANDDTMYVVNYYLQTLEGGYAMHQATPLTGTTDTTANAEIKEYEHFTYNASKSTVSGNINGDGSLVLNVYYTRNSYTISAIADNTKAGTISGAGSYRFDKQITLTATTNAGYTFLGWYEGETCICATEAFTFNVDGDSTYTAKWQANDDTMYVVNYYLQTLEGGYAMHQATPLTGTTDTTANAEIKEYQHFTYNEAKSAISGNINGDGSLVLNVYYTRDTYTIAIEVNNAKAGTVTGNGTYLFDKQITLTATTNAGYTFLGWYEGEAFINDATSLTFTVENDVSYTAKWFTHTDTKYIVNYYWQNIDDDDYTLHETVKLIGITDTEAIAEIKEYEHFTFNENESEIIGNINGDDSLVLGVYYTRNIYSLSIYESRGGVITKIGNYKYGKEIETKATPYLGYNFLGWYYNEEIISTEPYYTLAIDKNITAKFEEKEEMSNFSFTTNTSSCSITGILDETVTEITVPDYVTGIRKGVFAGCDSLTVIRVPFLDGKISTLFSADPPSSLKNITITGGAIAEDAFENCDNITSVILGDKVTDIGNTAFISCDNLKSVIIGNSVTSIGGAAFKNCYRLRTIIIGNSVTSIASEAFYDCSISDVFIPKSVTFIGYRAFLYCPLSKVTFEDTSNWYSVKYDNAGTHYSPINVEDSADVAEKMNAYWSVGYGFIKK